MGQLLKSNLNISDFLLKVFNNNKSESRPMNYLFIFVRKKYRYGGGGGRLYLFLQFVIGNTLLLLITRVSIAIFAS